MLVGCVNIPLQLVEKPYLELVTDKKVQMGRLVQVVPEKQWHFCGCIHGRCIYNVTQQPKLTDDSAKSPKNSLTLHVLS